VNSASSISPASRRLLNALESRRGWGDFGGAEACADVTVPTRLNPSRRTSVGGGPGTPTTGAARTPGGIAMSETKNPEVAAPYGGGAGTAAPVRRVRTHHLREMKERGERITMLTSYDMYTAATFDEAGIDMLL